MIKKIPFVLMSLLLLLLIACSGGIASDSFSNDPAYQKLIATIKNLQESGKLDGTVIIGKGNQHIAYFDNSADLLDPAQGIDGQYTIGSVGKQMMASALLKAMCERAPGDTPEKRSAFVEHQLKLPIISFLPSTDKVWQCGVPEWASRVTIHQLLCHRSGIPDFTRFESYFTEDADGKQFEEKPHEAWEFLALIEGEPLDFEPGTSEAYSNTGYVLVKEIIRAVTGVSAQEYMNKDLFKPLGMDHTQALSRGDKASLLAPLRYDPAEPTKPLYSPTRHGDPTGGGPIVVATTALDLLKWNLALHRDLQVLPKPLYDLFISPHSNGPTGYGYGYGISRDKTRFGLGLSHSAAGGARVVYIPSEEISLIVLNHVIYDWDCVENYIQQRTNELVIAGNSRSLAEKQATSEILEKYPPEQRGYEAIVNAFDIYLNG